MKVNVTTNLIRSLVCFFIIWSISSCKTNSKNEFFEQSFPNILESYFSYKLKYVYPKYDSINDKLIEVQFADADTMPKLKVYIQKESFSLKLFYS